jgi:circadian clock protein KaiC
MSSREIASTRCDSGISGLNIIWGRGFPSNALYLVEGDPGVGKTTLALQVLMAGFRLGEASLYVTFSETSAELFAVARSHGWSLEGIGILELEFCPTTYLGRGEHAFDPADIELHDVTKTSLPKCRISLHRQTPG